MLTQILCHTLNKLLTNMWILPKAPSHDALIDSQVQTYLNPLITTLVMKILIHFNPKHPQPKQLNNLSEHNPKALDIPQQRTLLVIS